MEFTPLAPVGAAINKTAGVLDEARQVAFEDKPIENAITDTGVGVVIDKSVSGWGNAARSVSGADNVVISTYESSASNFFQWVADKVTSYLRDHDNDNKEEK